MKGGDEAQQRPCCPTQSVWTGLPTPTLHIGQGQHSGASPPQRKDHVHSTAGGGVGPGGPAVGSGPGAGASVTPLLLRVCGVTDGHKPSHLFCCSHCPPHALSC